MTASLCFKHVDPDVRVIELSDLPRPSPAVPEPIILADEGRTIISYETWGKPESDQWVIVQFILCSPHAFGPPNDEAIDGHPFYELGVGPYGCYEIMNSPWDRALERANRVHHRHDPNAPRLDRHFIITFHDSTFECIARDFKIHATITDREKVIDEMLRVWKEID